MRALAINPSALEPGYNRVPREIDLAVAEEALGTFSTVEVD
jgi:hypothetical protein